MEGSRSLFIPVILGTTRQGRMSLHVSRLITQEVAKQNGIETELIDIATVSLPTGDAGEAIKEAGFFRKEDWGDGLAIWAPETNHGYPRPPNRLVGSCLHKYMHKSVRTAR